jgi:hypothetical protein
VNLTANQRECFEINHESTRMNTNKAEESCLAEAVRRTFCKSFPVALPPFRHDTTTRAWTHHTSKSEGGSVRGLRKQAASIKPSQTGETMSLTGSGSGRPLPRLGSEALSFASIRGELRPFVAMYESPERLRFVRPESRERVQPIER